VKVYLVVEHHYEFDDVHGVYSNKKAAEQHILHLMSRPWSGGDLVVEPWDVHDGFVPEDA